MSLRLEPTISRATGSPMRRATQAASTLPKLPVGTLNATSRSGRAQRQRGGDVVRDLRGDARPVDRVHRRQLHLLAERRVGEHRLHQVLAVVEGALDGDVGDVRRGHRGHLPALHLADAVVRVQEHDVDAVAAGARPRWRRSRCRPRWRRRSLRAASRAASTWSNRRPSSCSAMSLKASVGPWNSSCTNRPVSSWISGTTAGWPKPA